MFRRGGVGESVQVASQTVEGDGTRNGSRRRQFFVHGANVAETYSTNFHSEREFLQGLVKERFDALFLRDLSVLEAADFHVADPYAVDFQLFVPRDLGIVHSRARDPACDDLRPVRMACYQRGEFAFRVLRQQADARYRAFAFAGVDYQRIGLQRDRSFVELIVYRFDGSADAVVEPSAVVRIPGVQAEIVGLYGESPQRMACLPSVPDLAVRYRAVRDPEPADADRPDDLSGCPLQRVDRWNRVAEVADDVDVRRRHFDFGDRRRPFSVLLRQADSADRKLCCGEPEHSQAGMSFCEQQAVGRQDDAFEPQRPADRIETHPVDADPAHSAGLLGDLFFDLLPDDPADPEGCARKQQQDGDDDDPRRPDDFSETRFSFGSFHNSVHFTNKMHSLQIPVQIAGRWMRYSTMRIICRRFYSPVLPLRCP